MLFWAKKHGFSGFYDPNPLFCVDFSKKLEFLWFYGAENQKSGQWVFFNIKNVAQRRGKRRGKRSATSRNVAENVAESGAAVSLPQKEEKSCFLIKNSIFSAKFVLCRRIQPFSTFWQHKRAQKTQKNTLKAQSSKYFADIPQDLLKKG